MILGAGLFLGIIGFTNPTTSSCGGSFPSSGACADYVIGPVVGILGLGLMVIGLILVIFPYLPDATSTRLWPASPSASRTYPAPGGVVPVGWGPSPLVERYCPHCGAGSPRTSGFCHRCGRPLAAPG